MSCREPEATRWRPREGTADGVLAHSGAGAGTVAGTMPWHVMRNGSVSGQYARGRADEVAVYDTALAAATIRSHFEAGRDVNDMTAPAAPAGLRATARLGRVDLDWNDVTDADLDGYDVFRATSAAGPFTRINPSRLSASAYSDTTVTGGTTYVYVVTATVPVRRAARAMRHAGGLHPGPFGQLISRSPGHRGADDRMT